MQRYVLPKMVTLGWIRLFCVFLCFFGGAGRGAIAFFGFAGTIHTVKTLCECDLRKNPLQSYFCGKDAFF
jgi:hypothetical protein